MLRKEVRVPRTRRPAGLDSETKHARRRGARVTSDGSATYAPAMKRVAVLLLPGFAAVSSAVAAGWPGPPQTAAPRLERQGPPAAWVESASHSRWMAFSSYCWSAPIATGRKAVCADMIPPQSRTDLPTLRVSRGELLRIHLGFSAREAHLTLFQQLGFRHYVLRTGRLLTWRVSNEGVVSVDVRAAAGDGAYLLRLRLRN